MNNLYNVMTVNIRQNKGKLVNFRVSEELKRDFEITAQLRGASLSGLIHQLLVKAMREEKDREPKAFEGNIILDGDFKPESQKIIGKKNKPIITVKHEGDLDGDEKSRKTKKNKAA